MPPEVGVNTGRMPTYSALVDGEDAIEFKPGVNRVFVAFRDVGGVVRGMTSVAVRT